MSKKETPGCIFAFFIIMLAGNALTVGINVLQGDFKRAVFHGIGAIIFFAFICYFSWSERPERTIEDEERQIDLEEKRLKLEIRKKELEKRRRDSGLDVG
jgi:hypothetical protein